MLRVDLDPSACGVPLRSPNHRLATERGQNLNLPGPILHPRPGLEVQPRTLSRSCQRQRLWRRRSSARRRRRWGRLSASTAKEPPKEFNKAVITLYTFPSHPLQLLNSLLQPPGAPSSPSSLRARAGVGGHRKVLSTLAPPPPLLRRGSGWNRRCRWFDHPGFPWSGGFVPPAWNAASPCASCAVLPRKLLSPLMGGRLAFKRIDLSTVGLGSGVDGSCAGELHRRLCGSQFHHPRDTEVPHPMVKHGLEAIHLTPVPVQRHHDPPPVCGSLEDAKDCLHGGRRSAATPGPKLLCDGRGDAHREPLTKKESAKGLVNQAIPQVPERLIHTLARRLLPSSRRAPPKLVPLLLPVSEDKRLSGRRSANTQGALTCRSGGGGDVVAVGVRPVVPVKSTTKAFQTNSGDPPPRTPPASKEQGETQNQP